MNLLQAKTQALDLISSAGDSDYTDKAVALANHAQFEIAEIEKIKGTQTITQIGEDIEGNNSYTILGYKELRYVTFGEDRFLDFKIEDNKISIPKVYDGTFTIFFYKYPSEIDSTTPDTYEFEISIRGQMAIPYYVAAMLVMEENKNLSDKLYGIYIQKLKVLQPIADNNFSQIIDVTGW